MPHRPVDPITIFEVLLPCHPAAILLSQVVQLAAVGGGKKAAEWLNPRPVRKVVSFVSFDLLPLSIEADTRIALHVLWWGEGGAKLLLLWGWLFVFCGLLGDVLIAGPLHLSR